MAAASGEKSKRETFSQRAQTMKKQSYHTVQMRRFIIIHTGENVPSGSAKSSSNQPKAAHHRVIILDLDLSQLVQLQFWLVRFESHRWSARPDQVPPLLWFFPSILGPLEGRTLWFGRGWRRWKVQFILKKVMHPLLKCNLRWCFRYWTHSGPWTAPQSRSESRAESWSYWSCWRNWSLRCRCYWSVWEPVSPLAPTAAEAPEHCGADKQQRARKSEVKKTLQRAEEL